MSTCRKWNMMPWPSCVSTAIFSSESSSISRRKKNVCSFLFASLDLHIVSIAIEEGQRNSGPSNDRFTLRKQCKAIARHIYILFICTDCVCVDSLCMAINFIEIKIEYLWPLLGHGNSRENIYNLWSCLRLKHSRPYRIDTPICNKFRCD